MLSPNTPQKRAARRIGGLVILAVSVAVLVVTLWQDYTELERNRARMPAATVCGAEPLVAGPQDEALRAFARSAGLDFPEVFVSVANTLHFEGRLPRCYLTKEEARRVGWRPGRNLWEKAPGRAIGGDAFGNREGRLPAIHNGRYRVADLAFDGRRDGGRRGAHRLVFVEGTAGDWLMWVTVDHYERFLKVPAPRGQ